MRPLHKATSAERIDRDGAAYDPRFRRLVGEGAWATLPRAVQRRFSKRLGGTAVALYRGEVVETRFAPLGWMLAQACRLIGAPLPLFSDDAVAAVVSVSEDAASGGQVWSRLYARRTGFPQVIHSAKRFAGQTGLEEYVGRGIGMALKVEVIDTGLRFVSDHYFLIVGQRRMRLPPWLTPGRTVVEHRDRGGGQFAFDLTIVHPWLGELLHQHALFDDA